ncbi:MAG: elongation factor P lysine(34) lysyltransferase, partial [Gammaproteobacteria bacterium]
MNEVGIMEVETPILASSTATDPNIRSFETRLHTEPGNRLYLQTSPEFHMKRLLAAGSGSIFQISRAFRDEESGRYHNPEFTMLEWYRPGFDHHELMNEIESLLDYLGLQKPVRISYADVFLSLTGFDPHS